MIRETAREGDALIARCVGALDAGAGAALRAWAQNLPANLEGATRLRLDMRAVPYARAEGLQGLLALIASARVAQAKVVVMTAPGPTRAMLEWTRFDLACALKKVEA